MQPEENQCAAMGKNPHYGKSELESLKAKVKQEKRTECINHLHDAEANLSHYEEGIGAQIWKHEIAALKLKLIAYFNEVKD